MQSKSHMPHISPDAAKGRHGKLEMKINLATTISVPAGQQRPTEGQQRRNGIMSTLMKTLKNATSADQYRNGVRGKKVVVIHKNQRQARRPARKVKVVKHYYAPKPAKVVHHHYRPAPVKVVHHHYKPRRNYRPANVRMNNQTGGLIIGALLGAATGSQFGKGNGRVAAVLTGTVLGAVIGGQIGSSMDRADHVQVQNAMETAPTGRSVNWQNPDNGNQYTVTPTRTYRTASNGDCRDYDAWVFIGGYERKVTGTACRTPDGAWQQVQG